jgi:hypothetical protein
MEEQISHKAIDENSLFAKSNWNLIPSSESCHVILISSSVIKVKVANCKKNSTTC